MSKPHSNPSMISEAVRSNGYCGEVSADGEFVCIKDMGHDGPHGDERWSDGKPHTRQDVQIIRRAVEGKYAATLALANLEQQFQRLEEQLEAADKVKSAMVRANQRQVDEITSLREQLETAHSDRDDYKRDYFEAHAELRGLREQYEDARATITTLEIACDHHRMFWQKAEERERGLKEQLDALVAIIMDPDLDLDVAAADAQDYIAALNPAGELTPLQRAYGGKVRTVSTEPSNPASEPSE